MQMTGSEQPYKPGQLGALYKENSFYFNNECLQNNEYYISNP
jgi:hypothetical protein